MSNARKIADLGSNGTLPASQVSGLGALAVKDTINAATDLTGLGALATKDTVSAATEVTGLGALATKSTVGETDLADNAVVTSKIAGVNVTPEKLSQKLTLETAKASTSGTSVVFESIPSWVNRITMTFNGVSTNGSSIVQVQLGDSDGYETSGYTGVACAMVTTSASGYGFTSGHHLVTGGAATHSYNGVFYAVRINSTTWAMSSHVAYATNSGAHSASTKALSGQLDKIRLTTVNGTDTFDAGSVNILYE